MFILVLLATTAGPVAAHEFWISPHRYTIDPGAEIIASLRVGENFNGPTSGFLPGNFSRYAIVVDGKAVEVTGRLGDDPALRMAAPQSGLAVIVHQTTNSTLRYTDWEKFTRFARHKGFAGALAQHKRRGLPQTDFLERYRRLAKSLIAVGHGKGRDRRVGLETEFVAEANPYTDDLRNGLPVQLFHGAAPRAGAQVEVFEKSPDGKVAVNILKTDHQGRARIPAKPGHEYLLDAVLIRPLDAKNPRSDPVWETLWAGLTYQVGRRP